MSASAQTDHGLHATGGASGIGYAAAKILASHGAKVHILDLNPPVEEIPSGIEFTGCSVTSWSELCVIFERIGHVDMVFANAGVSEEVDYFEDTFDENGQLQEPRYAVMEVNLRAVINVIKLSLRAMRKKATGGSIVLTASATAYAPEQSLPVYSALKLAVRFRRLFQVDRDDDIDCMQLVGLVRSLRATVIRDNVTINAVAPAATITKLLPANLARPIMSAGLPVSSSHFVGLALVYSAFAKEQRQVEAYGKDKDGDIVREARWNGRCILTMGDRYTELEEPIANTKELWFGKENTRLTRLQQTTTDLREAVAFNRS